MEHNTCHIMVFSLLTYTSGTRVTTMFSTRACWTDRNEWSQLCNPQESHWIPQVCRPFRCTDAHMDTGHPWFYHGLSTETDQCFLSSNTPPLMIAKQGMYIWSMCVCVCVCACVFVCAKSYKSLSPFSSCTLSSSRIPEPWPPCSFSNLCLDLLSYLCLFKTPVLSLFFLFDFNSLILFFFLWFPFRVPQHNLSNITATFLLVLKINVAHFLREPLLR